MFDYVGVGILVALLVLFGALTVRALRARRLWVKIIGGLPAGLLTLALGAVTTVALIGFAKINAQQPNPVREFNVAGTPEQIAHGEKYARACAGCHAPNGQLPLTGQNLTAGAPFGSLYAPNLTQAHLAEWSDGEIIRAIREGVTRSGRSLMIMPSSAFHTMSDEDAQAIVAYLRSQPVDAPNTPPSSLNIMGAILVATTPSFQTVQPPIEAAVTAPPAGPTAEYGTYLLRVAGCMDCHGSDLNGAVSPEGAPAPSLLEVGANWSEDDFIATFRTGVTPDGHTLSEAMPWRDFEKFSDDDLRALYLGLKR